MIKTLPIHELEKRADNVYEASIILAKRARQINAEQKQLIMRERDLDEDYENYDEEEPEELQTDVDYLTLPKPAAVSVEEFLEGKLQYKYRDKEETTVEEKS